MASFAWLEFFVGGFISFVITAIALDSNPENRENVEKRVAEAYKEGFRKGLSVSENKKEGL